MKATLTVRIPDEIKEELEKISVEEKKPVSDLVRKSLELYVTIRQFRNLRKKALPFAEAQGLLGDEDIFKIVS